MDQWIENVYLFIHGQNARYLCRQEAAYQFDKLQILI